MKTQFSGLFDTYFSPALAGGSREGAIRAPFKGNTHAKPESQLSATIPNSGAGTGLE